MKDEEIHLEEIETSQGKGLVTEKTHGPLFVNMNHFSDTGLIGSLGHLKIKTRLINEKFSGVMGECVV